MELITPETFIEAHRTAIALGLIFAFVGAVFFSPQVIK